MECAALYNETHTPLFTTYMMPFSSTHTHTLMIRQGKFRGQYLAQGHVEMTPAVGKQTTNLLISGQATPRHLPHMY